MNDFKQLNVWQTSVDFVTEIYKATSHFPPEETYGITSQIRRSAVSIPSNIAEGACRNTNKDFNRFLGISNGSSGELETQLIIAKNLNFLDSKNLTVLSQEIDHIRRKTINLQKSLKL